MVEQFSGLHPMMQALIGTLFTWGVTALGAAIVFLFKDFSRRKLDGMLGFAAGVMIAASFWSLLAPAIEMSEIARDAVPVFEISSVTVDDPPTVTVPASRDATDVSITATGSDTGVSVSVSEVTGSEVGSVGGSDSPSVLTDSDVLADSAGAGASEAASPAETERASSGESVEFIRPPAWSRPNT